MAYAVVTWTAGDIATEAKMDQMTENAIASDSHAAGLLLNNNAAYQGKNTGGTAKDLLKLGTGDLLKISQIKNDAAGTITTKENLVMCKGWSWATGNGTTGTAVVITLPVTYDSVDEALSMVSVAGTKSGSNPTALSDCTVSSSYAVGGRITAGNQLTINVATTDGTNISTAIRIIVTYLAMGVIA